MLENEDRALILGFLGFYETSSQDGYVGAVLLTDHNTVPQDFRYTQPVKPTSIQKTLYGDTLEVYIGVDLCGVPIIQALQNMPSLILVKDEFLLNIRRSISCPTTYIRRHDGGIVVKSGFRGPKKETIDCSNGKFPPITVSTHSLYGDDMRSIIEILEKVYECLDPLEPFDRMEKALREIGL